MTNNEVPPFSSPQSPPPVPERYAHVTRVPVAPGETVETAEGVHIQFEKIVEDSRCPNGATCVWPGEAKIEAYITPPYKDGRQVKATSSILTIPGADRFAEAKAANTVSSDQWSVVFYGLEPYPEANQAYDSPPVVRAWFAVMSAVEVANTE